MDGKASKSGATGKRSADGRKTKSSDGGSPLTAGKDQHATRKRTTQDHSLLVLSLIHCASALPVASEPVTLLCVVFGGVSFFLEVWLMSALF